MNINKNSPRFKYFSMTVLLFLIVISVSCHWWCSSVHPFGLDVCWVLNADMLELRRGFPKYYKLVYFISLIVKYSFLPILTGSAIWLAGKKLRENLLLTAISLILTISLAEVGLRLLGYSPGQFSYNQWMSPVDSLYTLDGFVTDEFGLTRIDTVLVQKVMMAPNEYREMEKPYPENWRFWSELGDVFSHHGILANDEMPDNEFRARLRRVRDGKSTASPWSDSLFVNYAASPFNSDGYYSINFDTSKAPGPRILLLGDSFTWGHSAEHLTSSFANILLARGYTVYNTGLSGADVPHYQSVLNQHGEKLKPDIVILNFFFGNDLSYFTRVPKAGIPFHYHTNAGAILSNQFGVEFSTAQDAYGNVMRNMVIPQNTSVNRLMSKTVLTTLIWESLAHGIIDHEFFIGKNVPERPITDSEIDAIAETCDRIGAHLILCVIPKLEKGKVIGAESIPGLFGPVPFYQVEVSSQMYNVNDGHFNDAGHLVYADFLEALIKKELAKESNSETRQSPLP